MIWKLLVLTLLLLVQSSLCKNIFKRSLDIDDAAKHVNDYYIPRYVIPSSYKLSFVVDPEEGEYKGEVLINITCVESTSNIILHSSEHFTFFQDQSSVELVNIDGYPQARKKSSLLSTRKNLFKMAAIDNYGWYNISLLEPLQKGAVYQVNLIYSSKLNNETQNGFFVRSYADEETGKTMFYAATDMKSTKARNVFPCFDEPSFKVPIKVEVSAKEEYDVISSMPEIEETSENGWTVHSFKTTPPISTFSLGIAIMKLQKKDIKLDDPDVKVSLYALPSTLKETEYLEDFVVNFLEAVESYLDVSIPTEKLDLLILPNYTEKFKSDSWGIVTFSEDEMQPDYYVGNTAEMLTTPWFGHYVTPYWYNNLPLVVDIIKYVSTVCVDQVVEGKGMDNYFHNLFYIWYGNPNSKISSDRNADKAIFVFRMLNYTLTEPVFKKALNRFIEDRKYKVFTEIDFWNIFKYEGVSSGKIEKDFNILSMVETWINRDRYPVVTVTRNYKQRSAYVEQHVFLRDISKEDPDKDLLFYIPIMYVTEDNIDMDSIKNVQWMKTEKKILIQNLPKEDKFLILNPEEIGMFIVNYDAKNWALLSNYLIQSSQGNGALLPVATRAKLLNDALTLAYGGLLQYDTALDMVLFLRKETSYKVWQAYNTMVDHLFRRTEGTTAGEMFKEYSVIINRNLLKRLGQEKQNEDKDITELRNNAKYIIGRFTNETYASKYKNIISKWIQDDSMPNITDWEYNAVIWQVLNWGTEEEFEFLMNSVLSSIKVPETPNDGAKLSLLAGSTRGVDRIKRLLKEVLLDDSRMYSDDALKYMLGQCWGHRDGYVGLFEFISENWNALKQRYENYSDTWVQMFDNALNFKTQEGLNKVTQFYNQRKGQFGNAEDNVQEAIERVRRLADWSNKSLPVMETWFSQHLAEMQQE